MRKNIIITGVPGCGKSTLVKSIVAKYPGKVGFVTNEIREHGERTGFEIETHTGETEVLASTQLQSLFKVSKYFVDTEVLARVIPKVTHFRKNDLLYVDEIGQMQLHSLPFINDLVMKYFAAPNTTIMTMTGVYNDEIIAYIKKRRDIVLIEITKENREIQKKYIEELIKKIAKAKRYSEAPESFKEIPDGMLLTSDHGTRQLHFTGEWECDCPFYTKHQICSHVLAVEAYRHWR